ANFNLRGEHKYTHCSRRQEGTQIHILPNVLRGNTNTHFASLLDGTSAYLHLAFLNGIDKSSLVFSILDKKDDSNKERVAVLAA
ncbi:10060_t:CDS:2, partial [Funneliformis mosseae]